MPFTDLISASSMYVLDLQGMPPLKFLGHTNYLHKWSNYDSITQLPYLLQNYLNY